MKIFVALLVGAVGVAGCAWDGGPIFTGEGADHEFKMGGALEDSAPLSLQVKQALRKNPQTAVSLIQVSSEGDDSVKLAGYVNDDATMAEAERVAYQVPGIRFVVNALQVRR